MLSKIIKKKKNHNAVCAIAIYLSVTLLYLNTLGLIFMRGYTRVNTTTPLSKMKLLEIDCSHSNFKLAQSPVYFQIVFPEFQCSSLEIVFYFFNCERVPKT